MYQGCVHTGLLILLVNQLLVFVCFVLTLATELVSGGIEVVVVGALERRKSQEGCGLEETQLQGVVHPHPHL